MRAEGPLGPSSPVVEEEEEEEKEEQEREKDREKEWENMPLVRCKQASETERGGEGGRQGESEVKLEASIGGLA